MFFYRGMASCLSVMLGRSSAFLGVNAIGALISVDCEATFYGWALLLLSEYSYFKVDIRFLRSYDFLYFL